MNFLHGAVQVGASLVVYVHEHGTSLSCLLHVTFGLNNHEMYVQRLLAYLGNGLDDGKAERDVRHKYTVHDIEVQPVGLTLVYHLHLPLQVKEVGGQQ